MPTPPPPPTPPTPPSPPTPPPTPPTPPPPDRPSSYYDRYRRPHVCGVDATVEDLLKSDVAARLDAAHIVAERVAVGLVQANVSLASESDPSREPAALPTALDVLKRYHGIFPDLPAHPSENDLRAATIYVFSEIMRIELRLDTTPPVRRQESAPS